jgi:hypothetical protein
MQDSLWDQTSLVNEGNDNPFIDGSSILGTKSIERVRSLEKELQSNKSCVGSALKIKL